MAVTIKTPEEIEKMRVAGRLAAEVLRMIRPHVLPGVTTQQLDTYLSRLHRQRTAGHSRTPELPRISEIDLHLGQSCRLPRDSRRQGAEER